MLTDATTPAIPNRLVTYRVDSGNALTVQYDSMGNVEDLGTGAVIGYDAGGRLSSVWDTESVTGLEASYNGLGELARSRLWTDDPCSTQQRLLANEYFTFAPDGRALQIVSENASRTESDIVWLDDQPVAQFLDSYDSEGTYEFTTVTYLHTDHLNTPRLGTNENKQVTWRWQAEAFGSDVENPSPTGSAIVRLRFLGQIALGVGGVNYNYYRDYLPETGRYLESDPVGLMTSLNSYAYVDSSPMRLIDPLGLDACFVDFPDYPITIPRTSIQTTLTPGHAGTLGYDPATGRTRYYEYGRYDSDYGNVEKRSVPDLRIGKDGQPTPDSWRKLIAALERDVGKGTRTTLSCSTDVDEDKVYEYAERVMRDPNRPPYNWWPWRSNTCRDFAKRAIDAGR